MDNYISTQELNSGEHVGISVLEITSIPTFLSLAESYPQDADIEMEYRQGFSNLLTEVFQNYRTFRNRYHNSEISEEIVWITQPVNNQPFKAKIRLFLITRAIAGDAKEATLIVERLTIACDSMLRMHKFNTESVDAEDYYKIAQAVAYQKIEALVKEERVENLQNQMLPACYAFDRFEAYAHDLTTIVHSLIDHPNCALSIQLLPTSYTTEESNAISQLTPVLDTLSKGVMTQGIGNVSFSSADTLAETYRYYQTNRNNALFAYNFIVYGDFEATDDLSSKLHSYLSYDTTKTVSIKHIQLRNADLSLPDNLYALPWAVNELLTQTDRDPYIWGGTSFQSFTRLPYIITADEASGLFRLPIGTQRISAGLPINETESSSVSLQVILDNHPEML